jgi:uncharacterized UBP type Zn finger protein
MVDVYEGTAGSCPHLWRSDEPAPSAEGCEECLATGDSWVHLRVCVECGHVGCCDQSPNKHASKHFHATEHPVMKSFEPGEAWSWCYVDRVGYDPSDVDLEGADLS